MRIRRGDAWQSAGEVSMISDEIETTAAVPAADVGAEKTRRSPHGLAPTQGRSSNRHSGAGEGGMILRTRRSQGGRDT